MSHYIRKCIRIEYHLQSAKISSNFLLSHMRNVRKLQAGIDILIAAHAHLKYHLPHIIKASFIMNWLVYLKDNEIV